MRERFFFVLFLLLICGCSLSRKHETPPTEEISQIKKTTFFVPIPLTKFSSIQSPCMNVDIDENTFSMELDLGFRGDLTIAKEFSDQISSKMFICTKPMYGIRGKEYSTNLYRIPKMRIGGMFFIQPILQEEPLDFIKDSVFVQNGGSPSPRDPGRLGWELFYNVNLLVDIKNSKIAFCDSLDTLKDQGYAIETFIRTPLFLERGLVEFQAKTPKETLLCMLDTGSTWNIFNSALGEGKSIEQAIWEPENILKYSSFKIDENDFGTITFHRIPIKIPIPIEAILGMEFFRDHLVFLDFSGGYVYFGKTDIPNSPR